MNEKLQLPNEVVDADWKDDIDYETFEDEKDYISPKEIPETSIEKIKAIDLKPLFKSRGRKVAKIATSVMSNL